MSDNINNPCDLAVRCAKAELRVEQLAKDLEQQKKWNECTAEAYGKMQEKLDNAEADKNRAVTKALHDEYRKRAIESHLDAGRRVQKDVEIEKLKEENRLLRKAHAADMEYIRVLEGRPSPGGQRPGILLHGIAAAIGVAIGLCISKVIL